MVEVASVLALLGIFIASMTAAALAFLFFSNEIRRAKCDDAIVAAIAKGNYRNADKRVHNSRLRAVRKH
jgi:hypothetical protein